MNDDVIDGEPQKSVGVQVNPEDIADAQRPLGLAPGASSWLYGFNWNRIAKSGTQENEARQRVTSAAVADSEKKTTHC